MCMCMCMCVCLCVTACVCVCSVSLLGFGRPLVPGSWVCHERRWARQSGTGLVRLDSAQSGQAGSHGRNPVVRPYRRTFPGPPNLPMAAGGNTDVLQLLRTRFIRVYDVSTLCSCACTFLMRNTVHTGVSDRLSDHVKKQNSGGPLLLPEVMPRDGSHACPTYSHTAGT